MGQPISEKSFLRVAQQCRKVQPFVNSSEMTECFHVVIINTFFFTKTFDSNEGPHSDSTVFEEARKLKSR